LEGFDTVKHFRPLLTETKLFLNCEVDPDEAEDLIGKGGVDAVVFSRRFISNPDLATRLAKGAPLDQTSVTGKDSKTWYLHPQGHKEVGYSDYPSSFTST